MDEMLGTASGRRGPLSRARRNIRFRLFAIVRRSKSCWKWKTNSGSIKHRGPERKSKQPQKGTRSTKSYRQRMWLSFSSLCLLCIFVADSLFFLCVLCGLNPTSSINLKTQFLRGAGLRQSIDDGHLQDISAGLQYA